MILSLVMVMTGREKTIFKYKEDKNIRNDRVRDRFSNCYI